MYHFISVMGNVDVMGVLTQKELMLMSKPHLPRMSVECGWACCPSCRVQGAMSPVGLNVMAWLITL